MSKKLQGFSLAELLISLLIISIVLSAAIPTITRKAGADREQIWRWTGQGNNAYFGTGSNQSAIIGANSIPEIDNSFKDVHATDTDGVIHDSSQDIIEVDDLKYSNAGDKLVILKKSYSSLMNSHISFYNLPNKEGTTTNNITYAGRIAMDQGNIAIGMGTLQKMKEDNNGENTAVGHFALLKNTEGYKNTAFGKKALTFNELGSYNTALGYASAFKLGNDHESKNNQNTSIGSIAMHSMIKGNRNTAVGAQALRYNAEGQNNTVIGQSAMLTLTKGDNNTVIGSGACGHFTEGSNNICIGYMAGNSAIDEKVSKSTPLTSDTNGLYIGAAGDEAPLISGHTKKVTKGSNTYDKELIINARKIEFRPFNSSGATFSFHSYSGSKDDGYEDGNQGRWGVAAFNLRDTGGGGDKSSVSMTFGAVGTTATNKEVRIQTYDKYNTTDPDRMADISFNNVLKFDMPPFVDKSGNKNYTKVGIIAQSVPEGSNPTYKYILALNNKVEIENNDNAPSLYLTANDGFNLQTGADTDSYMKIQKNKASVFLNSGTNGNIFIDPENGVAWDTKGDNALATKGKFTIQATDATNSKIDLGNTFYVDKDKIYHKSIKIKQGQIGAAINDHEDRIKTLENGSVSSDERLKDISGDNVAGLKEINQIAVKNYTYKADKTKTPHVGVIAQQLQKIFPNSVLKGEDGFLRIKTDEIFYAMVNSIKELYVQVQTLTAKITGLDKRISELEKQNKLLLEQNKAFEKRLKKLEQKK